MARRRAADVPRDRSRTGTADAVRPVHRARRTALCVRRDRSGTEKNAACPVTVSRVRQVISVSTVRERPAVHGHSVRTDHFLLPPATVLRLPAARTVQGA